MTEAAASASPDSQPLFITIERNFKHPVEAVYRAWTESGALRNWMGPIGHSCPDAEIDARTGGRYALPMVSPDGTVNTARGEVLAMRPNELLHLSWAWDQSDGSQGQQMEVKLEFHQTPNGTRLVLTHTNFIDEQARDMHEGGWNGCLDSLAAYLD